jgi:pyruvate-ferredoxin/flavodoxin oxidoreductase
MYGNCWMRPSSSDLNGTEDVEKQELDQEFAWFRDSLGDFKFSSDAALLDGAREEAKGRADCCRSRSIPTCKGCMECVKILQRRCAYAPRSRRRIRVASLRKAWEFWQALPTTSRGIHPHRKSGRAIGALETLLLDKNNYLGMVGGDGACLGCGEKTVVHLFTATVEALMQPRGEEAGREDRRPDDTAGPLCPAEAGGRRWI